MSVSSIDDIVKRLRKLQVELEQEIDQLLTEKQQQFRYNLQKGKVQFEQGIKALQRRYKIGAFRYLRDARIGHLLTIPFVYIMIFPFTLLDLFVTFYQQICFRIYRIPLVKRSDYLIIDRQQLAYLNIFQKINCVYCGYGNGLIEYVREIAARTEQYWCPIKHARRSPDPHRLIDDFIDYGDAEAFEERLEKLQKKIIDLENTGKHKPPKDSDLT